MKSQESRDVCRLSKSRVGWGVPQSVCPRIAARRVLPLPLEQHGFECAGSLIRGLFSVNIQLALWLSHLWIQPTAHRKQYFQSGVRSPQMQGTNCMNHSVPFYIRDLNVLGFWYPRGSWNQFPFGY